MIITLGGAYLFNRHSICKLNSLFSGIWNLPIPRFHRYPERGVTSGPGTANLCRFRHSQNAAPTG